MYLASSVSSSLGFFVTLALMFKIEVGDASMEPMVAFMSKSPPTSL